VLRFRRVSLVVRLMRRCDYMNARFLFLLLTLAVCANAQVVRDTTKIVGPEECAKCHKPETATWEATHHFATYKDLQKSEQGKIIKGNLGISGSFKRNDTCTQCHYTLQGPADDWDAISGISCESCHGPAKDWLNIHNRKVTDDADKAKRLAEAVAAGMLNPKDIYNVAQNCYNCHTVPNENLVNNGGHAAGSPFELVSWSQGEVRHNFGGKEKNLLSPPERLQLMYVMGRALDLEYGLRGVAKATDGDKYGQAMATRVITAHNHLVEILKAGAQLPEIKDMLAAVPKPLTFESEARFLKAAEQVQAAARALQAKKDTYQAELAKVAALIPDKSTYRGNPHAE
jgi:hypothetical protein